MIHYAMKNLLNRDKLILIHSVRKIKRKIRLKSMIYIIKNATLINNVSSRALLMIIKFGAEQIDFLKLCVR